MKTVSIWIPSLCVIAFHSYALEDELFNFGESFLHPELEQIWSISPDAGLRAPESVIYDGRNQRLYVSNFNQKGGFIQKGDLSNDESISTISLDGKILDLNWFPNRCSPLGMILDEEKQHLYVVERNHVCVVDASGEKGVLVNTISLEGTSFPNDIARDAEGRLYVSDSGNRIWRCKHPLEAGNFELWLEGETLSQVNGLLVRGNELLAGCDDEAGIVAINLLTKDTRQVASPKIRPIDGIRSDGKGGLFVSWFKGRLAWVGPDGYNREILINNPEGPGIADFEYIADQKIFVLPDLLGNGIQAYRMKNGF